jgi:hypothetical protein
MLPCLKENVDACACRHWRLGWRGWGMGVSGHRSITQKILPLPVVLSSHGLINYIDTKAKCRHLKKLTCKGTLRQVFIRVYRLEIQSVMLVFSTHIYELLPISPSLWFKSPTPPPLPVWISILYKKIQVYCGGGINNTTEQKGGQ